LWHLAQFRQNFILVTKPSYRSRSGKHVYIKDADGDYVKYTVLDRPEGKWIKLQEDLELSGDGYENRLFLNIQVSLGFELFVGALS
jgi:hypothetical protein